MICNFDKACDMLQKSERNLRRALLMLETCRVMQSPMTANQEPQLPDWELYIQVSRLGCTTAVDIAILVILCKLRLGFQCWTAICATSGITRLTFSAVLAEAAVESCAAAWCRRLPGTS